MTNIPGDQSAGYRNLAQRFAARFEHLFCVPISVLLLGILWLGDYSLRSRTIGSLCVIAFAILLTRQHYRLRKSERVAAQAQAGFNAAAEGGFNAFYTLKNCRDHHHRIEDFIVTDINENGARLLGTSRDQAISQRLSTLLPDMHHTNLFERYVKVAAGDTSKEEEFEVDIPEINARWLHHQIVPLEDGVAVTTRDISERKYIEIETRNNRAFLHSLIDYLPVLIYARSVRKENFGRMIVWNQAAEAVTGYAAANVIGKTSREAFSSQLAERFEQLDKTMMSDPQVADIPEVPFERQDGGRRYLHIISVPLFDEESRVEYILGIAEDITGRRKQELELRTQQAELAAVNDASPLGLFRTGPDGACTYVNRTYEDMSGITREQALGDGWAKAIHPEDRLKVFQAWGKSSRTNQPYQGMYRFRHANGRIVWASMKTAPILVDGHNHGYVGSVDDITARREAELALSKSEQRLRTITDTLPALVAYIDADERYRFNNIAYERAFGVQREKIRNQTVREFLGDAEYSFIKPFIERVLTGQMVVFEKEEPTGDKYRCEESTYIPQFGEDSREVVGFHVMIQNITAKKLEERRLMHLAQIDSLTGLINRAGFEQKLADAMSRARTTKALMAMMYLDIDHFKRINDTLGHTAGDVLLKAFAARLSRTLRSIDTVARLGGDEFTVIMEDVATPEAAVMVAAKIVQSMESLFSLDGHPVSASTSIGVAFYQGGDTDPKTLIKRADEMLYQAKADGRNTYCVASLK